MISALVHGVHAREVIVAWIAEHQLGLITAAQLHRAGIGRGSIEWRLANGTLHRVFRGVYLVGHGVPVAGALELAAVLACGERTVVSHRSAAALWEFVKPLTGEVNVTVIARDCRSRQGLRVHKVETLDRRDRAKRRGIPATAPARTLIDYASRTGADEVDGGDFHRPRPAFERDHRRDIVHKDASHEVLRVSGQHLDQEPLYIAAVIARTYDRLSRTRG